MNIQILSPENLDKLVEFEQNARLSESDIFVDGFDSEKFWNETLSSLENPDFASAKCLMCADTHGNIIGRVDLVHCDTMFYENWFNGDTAKTERTPSSEFGYRTQGIRVKRLESRPVKETSKTGLILYVTLYGARQKQEAHWYFESRQRPVRITGRR